MRDWQNFECDEGEYTEAMQAEMDKYRDEMLETETRQDRGLQRVRELIDSTYEDIRCFLLPHPGFPVTKPSYDGNLRELRPEFVAVISGERQVSWDSSPMHLVEGAGDQVWFRCILHSSSHNSGL